LDVLYRSEYRDKIFTMTPLAHLKLVVDGNQFTHFISGLLRMGAYGGNYDLYYAGLRQILVKLKPSIHMVIFDGAKESIEKSKYRMEKKITRVADIEAEFNFYKNNFVSPRRAHAKNDTNAQAVTEKSSEMETDENDKRLHHFNDLQKYPSLFNRMIFYELLNELDIKYSMTELAADHAIALYANGFNDTNDAYTVLSKASFFNIYNLTQGYLCTRYLGKELENVDKLSPTETLLPVFHLNKLLQFFCLESQRTWIYFCILLGNNDDAELGRNTNYFRQYRIDTRYGQYPFEHLVAHIRMNEKRLIETQYSQIRCSYAPWQTQAERKIDMLIELFEMRNSGFGFVRPLFGDAMRVDDFDRVFLVLKHLKCVFFGCQIEDCANEGSTFEPAVELWRSIYLLVRERCVADAQSFDNVQEFVRAERPVKGSLVNSRLVDLTLPRKEHASRYLVYLKSHVADDQFSLLFISLIVWQGWAYKHLSREETALVEMLIESVLINYAVLKLRSDEAATSVNTVKSIVSLYDEFCTGYEVCTKQPNLDEYFKQDLKLIHRLSEFQAIYYAFGVLCKLVKFSECYCSPHTFFNAYFIKSLVKIRSAPSPLPPSDSCDMNNNVAMEMSKLESLIRLIDSCEQSKKLVFDAKGKFEAVKRGLEASDNLTVDLSTLKLNY
jgi:hypothetical protein